MNNRILSFLLLFILANPFFQQDKVYAWGWETHRYINENAVDYLPPEMDFFEDYRDYLRAHSIDPDVDGLPGYYHYIDIDYYPEFFEGTFPHDWDEAVDLYGYNVLIDNGTVPWVIKLWTDSLTVLMSTDQWETVWQVAAELGHYVADSHQPLHLTLNYNGQLTGNYGIHSRYETHMINPHLSELPLPDSTSAHWSSVIDSVFQYIDEIYPFVSDIMAADDLASTQDPDYNSAYYNILWDELDSLTISVIHCAIIDLASIWQTAWNNANSPTININISYMYGWNLIGLPLEVEDASYNFLFPESIEGTLYSFNGGYNPATNLTYGVGYWLRFDEAGSTTITGNSINELTISLNEGWNLISGISTPFDFSDIQDPDGIIISGTVYGFTSGGYLNTENIEPGKGYWVRTNNSGNIMLTSE